MNREFKFSAIGKAGGWAFLAIILCWLIVPLIIWIIYCINISYDKVVFTKDRVKITEGVIAKSSREAVLTQILSVSVNKTFWGSIFNYGTVQINTVGRHCDLVLSGIKDPDALKTYLNGLMQTQEKPRQFITE